MRAPRRLRGIVTGIAPLYETDKRVELFTLTEGRIMVRAKGASRSQKRFGGRLEPTTVLDVQLQGGGMPMLLDCEVVTSFVSLRSSFNAISVAMYGIQACRLATVPEQPNPDLYALLLDLLQRLDTQVPPKVALTGFQEGFLQVEGLPHEAVFSHVFELYTGQSLPIPLLIE